jgi:cytochrome c
MAFAGISRDTERADLINYLHTLSDNPLPLPKVAEGAAAPAGQPAPAGDKPAAGAAPQAAPPPTPNAAPKK